MVEKLPLCKPLFVRPSLGLLELLRLFQEVPSTELFLQDVCMCIYVFMIPGSLPLGDGHCGPRGCQDQLPSRSTTGSGRRSAGHVCV